MSWSITINNLPEYPGFTSDIIEQMLTQHPAYPEDMKLALDLAMELGLASASLSGGRTVNPYNDDEVVVVNVMGTRKALDFNAAIKRNIGAGPDSDALAKQATAMAVA